jgi:hypothetical protein
MKLPVITSAFLLLSLIVPIVAYCDDFDDCSKKTGLVEAYKGFLELTAVEKRDEPYPGVVVLNYAAEQYEDDFDQTGSSASKAKQFGNDFEVMASNILKDFLHADYCMTDGRTKILLIAKDGVVMRGASVESVKMK